MKWAEMQRRIAQAQTGPANSEFSAAQTATPAAASPSRAELIAWAAEMIGLNPKLFGMIPPGFTGPPQSGKARLWDTSVRPSVELPLPEAA